MSTSWSCKIAVENGDIENMTQMFVSYLQQNSPKKRHYGKGEHRIIVRYEKAEDIVVMDFLVENDEGDDFLQKFMETLNVEGRSFYVREGSGDGAYIAVYQNGKVVYLADEETGKCTVDSDFLSAYTFLKNYDKSAKILAALEEVDDFEDSPVYKLSCLFMPSLVLKKKRSGDDFKNVIWNDLKNVRFVEFGANGIKFTELKSKDYEMYVNEIKYKDFEFNSFYK